MKARVVGCVLSVVAAFGVTAPGGWSAALAQQAQPPAGDAKAAALAEEWVKNNPKGKTEASEKPQVKDNKCPQIPLEEREALGLPAPTWVAQHGKVQRTVREALEEQKKIIAKPDGMAWVQFDRPSGFEGTAYVDVYLRHEAKGRHDSKENQAAVREVQDRLLRKLTAAEFATIFVFKNTAGLVGYVDETGLKKLVDDADVLAVALDDQPRPKVYTPQFYSQGGENTGGGLPKVSAQVLAALEKVDEVTVIVNIQGGPEPMRGENWKKVRGVQDRVLSQLSARDFRLLLRIPGGHVTGFVTKAGLAKLSEHPDVVGVGLPGKPAQKPGFQGGRP